MTYHQVEGKVRVPAGKRVAVGLGVDFDALSARHDCLEYSRICSNEGQFRPLFMVDWEKLLQEKRFRGSLAGNPG